MTNYKAIDKKGFTQAQVVNAFDKDGKDLFLTAVKSYADGNKEKGVWATVQAGYDIAAEFYSIHNEKMPAGVIDYKSFGALADELAK